jgi:hypothetical protein
MAGRIAAKLGVLATVILCTALNGDAMAEQFLSRTQFAAGTSWRWERRAPRE